MEYFHACGFAPCKLLAQALGLLCNSCFVLPLDLALLLQLQYAINDKVKATLQGHSPLPAIYFLGHCQSLPYPGHC